MASTQISPGVVVLERDLTNTVNATVDNIGAIVGSFEKGPVEEVVTISNERQLIETFGKPNDYNYEYWFSVAQFLLYGGSVKVVRADNSALKNSIDAATFTQTTLSGTDTTLTVANATDFDAGDLLLIDAELLTVTSVSGLDILVARGQLSTSAVSHAAGSSITLIEASTASTLDNNGTLTDSATTVDVASATTLGVTTNAYVRIDDEIMQVTAIALGAGAVNSSDRLTVTRAVLGTTAAAHTDGVAITLQVVTASKTTVNEETSTGITAPLIKNLDSYEATTETAANNWKWAARTPGQYGNSIRVVMTDAGPDQILYLAQPSVSEWEMIAGKKVNVSASNVYSTVYDYRMVIEFATGSTLVGEFVAGNTFVGNATGGVRGTIVAYEASTRKLEVTLDYVTTSGILAVGDTVTGSNSAEGVVTSIQRKLVVALDEGSKSFTANMSVKDSSTLADNNTTNNGLAVNVASIVDEWNNRLYGRNQRWASIAGRPGTSAYAADRGGHRDLMHILVIDGDGGITGVPGSVLEKFLDVSKASDAKSPQGSNLYYKDVIKANSQYLWWGAHETTNLFDVNTTANGGFGVPASNVKFDLFKNNAPIYSQDDPTNINVLAIPLVGSKNTATVKYSLAGGVDGYTAQRDKLFDSYDLFSDAETEEVDYIIMGPAMSNPTDSVAKAQKMIDLAEIRKDCMAFISPPRDNVIGVANTNEIVNKTIDFFNQLSSSSYAVFDNNYKYIYDKYNDKYRYLPLNADIAGLTLSTALNQEPWYSPAGFSRGQIRNAVKLAYSPLKDHRDRLYAARINPVVAFPGEGIVLYGDKTALATSSAFDRINVRRLFLVIEKAISLAAKSQLFELNDEFTRQGFKNVVDPYLRGVQSRRGIIDYLVVCDRSNNPADAIDRGEFFAEIFVKPTRSINFITLQFTATRTGASFAEVAL